MTTKLYNQCVELLQHNNIEIDLINIKSFSFKDTTAEDFKDWVNTEYGLILHNDLKDYEVLYNQLVQFLELNDYKTLYSQLVELKNINKRFFNKFLKDINLTEQDLFYNSLDNKQHITQEQEHKQQLFNNLNIKISFKMTEQKKQLRTFKTNYSNVNNYIELSANSKIEDINKVVNLLKSQQGLKRFIQLKNEYRFIFYNGLIIIRLNQLMDCWYVSHNNTQHKTLRFFQAHKTHKYYDGINRQCSVEQNGSGRIKYNKSGFIKIAYKNFDGLKNKTL